MEENETQAETPKPKEKEEPAPEAEAAGDTGAETSETPIEKGEAIIKGIDERFEKFEVLTKRMEEAAGRMMMGGKSNLGEAPKTQEETDQEKIDAMVKATVERF